MSAWRQQTKGEAFLNGSVIVSGDTNPDTAGNSLVYAMQEWADTLSDHEGEALKLPSHPQDRWHIAALAGAIAAEKDDINVALGWIQDMIGQTDGGVAAIHFSDMDDPDETWRTATPLERRVMIAGWLKAEQVHSEDWEGPDF